MRQLRTFHPKETAQWNDRTDLTQPRGQTAQHRAVGSAQKTTDYKCPSRPPEGGLTTVQENTYQEEQNPPDSKCHGGTRLDDFRSDYRGGGGGRDKSKPRSNQRGGTEFVNLELHGAREKKRTEGREASKPVEK